MTYFIVYIYKYIYTLYVILYSIYRNFIATDKNLGSFTPRSFTMLYSIEIY